jgi:hypothetical protein
MNIGVMTSSAIAATRNSSRSGTRAGPNSQAPVTTASDATAKTEVTKAIATVSAPPSKSSPTPRGESTKMNGTRNAGSVYFHVSHIVFTGLPPVIAAAANGESAVGGETSLSTA